MRVVFSYACLTLCGDMFNHFTWAARHVLSAYVPGEHSCGSCLYTTVVLWPQILHIHVPQDFWGKEQLE